MSRIIFYGLLVILVISGCWNLEKYDIISFNNQMINNTSSFNFKNDIIQIEDNSYISVGTNLEGDLSIYRYSEDGIFVSENNILITGKGHRIIEDVENIGEYWILGTDNERSFLAKVDDSNSLLEQIDYFDTVNQQIGLLDTIALFDMVVRDSSILMTGYIKQEIGEKRMVVMKIHKNGELDWLRTYTENSIGMCIKNLGTKIVVSGFKDDKAFIASISDMGVLNWEKKFSDTRIDYFNSIETEGDSLIYFIGSSNGVNGNRISFKVVDENQSIILEKYFGDENNISHGYNLKIDRNQNLLLLGSKNPNELNPEVQLLNISPDGTINWEKFYKSNQGIIPSTILQVNDSGNLMYGVHGDSLATKYQLIKTDEDGVIR